MAVNSEAADTAAEMAPYARFPVAGPSTAALAALRDAVGEVLVSALPTRTFSRNGGSKDAQMV
jgi:hypothetical protein